MQHSRNRPLSRWHDILKYTVYILSEKEVYNKMCHKCFVNLSTNWRKYEFLKLIIFANKYMFDGQVMHFFVKIGDNFDCKLLFPIKQLFQNDTYFYFLKTTVLLFCNLCSWIIRSTLSVCPIKNSCCPVDVSMETMIAWQGYTTRMPLTFHRPYQH
jgi:hypothetical protein